MESMMWTAFTTVMAYTFILVAANMVDDWMKNRRQRKHAEKIARRNAEWLASRNRAGLPHMNDVLEFKTGPTRWLDSSRPTGIKY